MSYADKLRDPRWKAFRDDFIRQVKRQRRLADPEADDDWCEGCGFTADPFHAHHRIYIEGREPWEYSFDCLSALCAGCHERIHRVEKIARRLIIESEPHVLYELEEFLEEFEKCENRKLAARCAYRAALRVQEAERTGASFSVSGIKEMALACLARYSAMVTALEKSEISDFEAQDKFYGE